MSNIFKPHEKYRIRHLMLVFLKRRLDRQLNNIKSLDSSNTPLQDVADALGISYKKAYDYHHALHKDDQVKCFTESDKEIHYIGLHEKGLWAIIDEYWLREGQKELNERIYDKTKWTVPVLALIATIGSTLYSAWKVSSMQSEVNKLKTEIIRLDAQSRPQTQSKISSYPRP